MSINTVAEVLVDAFKTGHAWDPAYPNLQNLDLAAVQKMDGTERDAKDLIASRQYSDIAFDGLVEAFHQREAYFDGDVGPATLGLVNRKRCPIPDFPPPPGASFDTGDAELNAAIKSYQEFKERIAELGTGSWPSCDPTRSGVNSFRVNLDLTRCPSTVRSYLDKSLLAVRQAYAEMGCAVRYIYDGDPNECEIAKRWESLSGSVIGWNEFPSPNTCDQVISGRLDTGYQPDYKYFANLECHETGHGVGLDHTRGNIMNPSILLIWPLTWRGSPSESNLKRWFGGIPIPLDGGDSPILKNPKIEGELFGELFAGNYIVRGQQFLTIEETTKPGVYKYTCSPIPGIQNKFRLVQSAEV